MEVGYAKRTLDCLGDLHRPGGADTAGSRDPLRLCGLAQPLWLALYCLKLARIQGLHNLHLVFLDLLQLLLKLLPIYFISS